MTSVVTIGTTQTVLESTQVTTTVTTTLAPVKKRLAKELHARILPLIPDYLAGLTAAKISAACSCLNLPTPSTTSVVTAKQTSTVVVSYILKLNITSIFDLGRNSLIH